MTEAQQVLEDVAAYSLPLLWVSVGVFFIRSVFGKEDGYSAGENLSGAIKTTLAISPFFAFAFLSVDEGNISHIARTHSHWGIFVVAFGVYTMIAASLLIYVHLRERAIKIDILTTDESANSVWRASAKVLVWVVGGWALSLAAGVAWLYAISKEQ